MRQQLAENFKERISSGWLMAVLILVASVAFDTSCGGYIRTATASEKDLLGVWHGGNKATLTLYRGHKLSMENFPLQLIGPDFFDSPVSGTGTWYIETHSRLDYQTLVIDYKRNEAGLAIDWTGSRYRLFFFLGDPDEGRRYWLDKSGSR